VDPEACADGIVDTDDLNSSRLAWLGHAPVLSDGVVVVDVLSLSDAHAHWAGEDDEHARRFGWYPHRSTLEGVRKFIVDAQHKWHEGGSRGTLAIRMAATRTLVGGCEARLQSEQTAEVSWWIFPEYRRRGLATRGVRLMLDYFSTTASVRNFVALIEPDNYASRGVARRTGFVESDLDASGPRPMLRYQHARGPCV